MKRKTGKTWRFMVSGCMVCYLCMVDDVDVAEVNQQLKAFSL